MKTSVLKLIPLFAALMLASCNEQVSSDLEGSGAVDGSTGGSTGGSSVIPENFTFKITNTSLPELGYNLHRTGYDQTQSPAVSKKTTECKITSPDGVPLTNDLYDAEESFLTPHDDKVYDISCFMEVEELSMFHSGFSFQVEASPNACHFVSYSPYSYFSMMPGSSTTTYRKLSCPVGATATPPGQNGQGCGTYRNAIGAGAANEIFASNIAKPEADADLCRFNYDEIQGPNCDTGTVTILQYNYELSIPADPTSALVLTSTPTTTTKVICGGKAANCVNGAIRDVSAAANFTSFSEVSGTAADTAFTRVVTAAPTMGTTFGNNRKYVNFRRNLASPAIEYGDPEFSYLAYKNGFDSTSIAVYGAPRPNSEFTFNPNLVANYSRNRKMNLFTQYVDTTVLTTPATSLFAADFFYARPFASEPFMSVMPGVNVNPFYTFTCLDRAYEPKARIRLVVREFDRVFAVPTTSTNDHAFDYISDIFMDNTGVQDNFYEDSYGDNFNDLGDWDDYLYMRRTGAAFNSTTTNYVPLSCTPDGFPTTSVNCVDGWFTDGVFPFDLLTPAN